MRLAETAISEAWASQFFTVGPTRITAVPHVGAGGRACVLAPPGWSRRPRRRVRKWATRHAGVDGA
jgi:hypothetical protein